jgi:hypothetical protein
LYDVATIGDVNRRSAIGPRADDIGRVIAIGA